MGKQKPIQGEIRCRLLKVSVFVFRNVDCRVTNQMLSHFAHANFLAETWTAFTLAL